MLFGGEIMVGEVVLSGPSPAKKKYWLGDFGRTLHMATDEADFSALSTLCVPVLKWRAWSLSSNKEQPSWMSMVQMARSTLSLMSVV